MTHRLEYVSADRSITISFDPNAESGPYMLLSNPRGIIRQPSSALSRRAPSQRGSTLTDILIGERSIPISVAILAASDSEYWNRREALVDALVVEPKDVTGGVPAAGYLKLYRPGGLPTLQIPVVPDNSPQEAGRPDPFSLIVDIEFKANQAYWEEEVQQSVQLAQAVGGFTFPMTFPFSPVSNNVQQTIVNAGNVATPILGRMYGGFTNGRLTNVTTGEVLTYTGVVAAGDYIEIDTSFGRKRVEQVTAAGVRTNVMQNITVTTSKFWQLRRGPNVIKFDADVNPSGSAVVLYQQRYAGV